MLRKFLIDIIFWGMLLGVSHQGQAASLPKMALTPQDRILVLAPHPDDEVLGAGGILARAARLKLPVKVAFLTNGDSNQWSFLLYRKHPVIMPKSVLQMGLVRKDEAISAAETLGLDHDDLVFLGYPDFGTLAIWNKHWGDRPSYKSLFTQVRQVPYQGAYQPQAQYKGEAILHDLRSILRAFKPTKIFVSHPLDQNGDHQAFYLFLRVALWDEMLEQQAGVYPFLIHYTGWPKPYGRFPHQRLYPPQALRQALAWQQFELDDEEVVLKEKALQAHASQYRSSRNYLTSFIRANELFGDFPTKVLQKATTMTLFSPKKRFASWGMAWSMKYVDEGHFEMILQSDRVLKENVEAKVYLYGYQRGHGATPFADMPKISINLGADSYTVYHQKKRIAQDAIMVKRDDKKVIIRIPWSLVGNPNKILVNTQTFLKGVALDNTAWVAVEIR